jgi:hypothetical protein
MRLTRPPQLYHEATVCNLLEVLLFHDAAITAAEGKLPVMQLQPGS